MYLCFSVHIIVVSILYTHILCFSFCSFVVLSLCLALFTLLFFIYFLSLRSNSTPLLIVNSSLYSGFILPPFFKYMQLMLLISVEALHGALN